jgi:AcrR family transcriptional regulator
MSAPMVEVKVTPARPVVLGGSMARAKSPLRKAPGDYHHGNLRRALLDAAKVLLEEHGPESFTLREAARRVGVDHRAAYKHFADREEVLAAVAEEGYRGLIAAARDELAATDADAGAEARLLAIARAYLRFATSAPGSYRLMSGPRLNKDGRFPVLEDAIDEASALIRREVRSGMDGGTFAPSDLVSPTLALWSAMHGLASLVIMRRIRVRKEALGAFAESQLAFTIRGMKTSRNEP